MIHLITTSFLLNYVPMLATVFLTACYLPQIIKTIKTKDVSSMSLWFWILLCIALSLLLLNATVIFIHFATWGYMIEEALNDGLAIVVLIMVIKYRNRKGK